MTKIEWTEKTWNPIHGCTKVSEACQNCYAEVMARRLQGNHIKSYENGFKVSRNMHYVMRRDLGDYWRPAGWSGYKHPTTGEGEWKPEEEIHDRTPWMYYRQVLARFDPDNQWAVSVRIPSSDSLDRILRLIKQASIISLPTIPHTSKEHASWTSDTATLTIRAYHWQDDYLVDWDRRISPDTIVKAERLEIPDTKEM